MDDCHQSVANQLQYIFKWVYPTNQKTLGYILKRCDSYCIMIHLSSNEVFKKITSII